MWVKSGQEVKEIGRQNYVKRLVNRDNDARAIAGEIAAVNWSINTFMASKLGPMKLIFTTD